MAMKRYKPNTPGFRSREICQNELVTESKAEKSLITGMVKNNAGRNNTGRITVRRRGGGAKRLYRKVDFKRDKDNIKGRVESIQYDPNRTSYIALVSYQDGEKRYIILPESLKVGDFVESGSDVDIKVGNTLCLKYIPIGSVIHNVELTHKKGAQLARSAGSSVTLMGRNAQYVILKLPSGEKRLVHELCKATLGSVSKKEHRHTKHGKAGASRWNRKRPKVRGSAMNACDHPHGGGEGRAPIGQPSPRSPWGKKTLGKKTRNNKNKSNRLILTRRK